MFGKIAAMFNKKQRKIIQEMTSKPKVRKRYYNMWKCSECGEEYYFQSIRCPICSSKVQTVKKYTTFIKYPLMKYIEGTQ